MAGQSECSALVQRARAMVAEQARCSLAAALAIMLDLEQSTGESLHAVAEEIVAGTVRFDGPGS